MRVLFIGGTGNLSTACARLAVRKGMELSIVNRGSTKMSLPDRVVAFQADLEKPGSLAAALRGKKFDVVVNFLAFTPEDVQRDMELFQGKVGQYVFISSASCYQKPITHPVITESTPLVNPYWDYSRAKIACEEALMRAHRDTAFPVTIIRPSLTYQYVIPLVFGAWREYTLVDRMKRGLPVIVHGDGTSLWTITHAEDFALGLVGLLGNPAAVGHAFHITSDEVLTWDEMHRLTAAAAGAEAHIIHIPSDFIARFAPQRSGTLLGDKAHSAIFDNSKIKAFVPEFKATIPYRQGIKKTLEWFEGDPARMVVRDESNRLIDDLIDRYQQVFDGLN